MQFAARMSVFVSLVYMSASTASPPPLVTSPYTRVDWSMHHQHLSNFHTHTTQSDGRQDPSDVIDLYHALGYTVLAITDHNSHTWDWEFHGRAAGDLGMVAVRGNELSHHHHVLSLFCDLETETRDLVTALGQVQEKGGLSVLAHPGRYWELDDGAVPEQLAQQYVLLFQAHPSLIGMEVVNQDDRFPHDRSLWDALLTELMPQRTVWGLATDDSHFKFQIGVNATVLLLPELSEDEVRSALEEGRFYFTSIATHPPETRDRRQTPVIRSIRYDPDAGTIGVEAESGGAPVPDEAYRWISARGTVIHRGRVLKMAGARNLEAYVRLEIRGGGGTAFTQPFAIEQP